MAISTVDKRILAFAELQADMPITELAKQAGLRTHTVYYSLNKLEREGLIRRVPFVNMSRLGYSDYLLLFSLAVHDPQRREAFISYLQENALVTWLAEMGGDYQYGIALYVKSAAELSLFLADLSERFGGLFFEKTFSLHTRFARFSRTYLYPEAPRQIIQSRLTDAVCEIDELDHRILVAMTERANMTQQDIARSLEIPFSTLNYRIQALKKNGVLERQTYAVDTSKLKIQSFEVLIRTKDLDAALPDKLFHFAKCHPNVVYFIQCIGSWDFELGLEVEVMHEATGIVQEIYATFSDTITTITTIPLFRQLKFNFYRNELEQKV